MRHRDAAGEQRGEHSAGRARVMHLLADDHRVGAVAAPAADGFGQARAEQPGVAGLAVQVARQFADAFPLVDVRQHFTFGERAHRLSQLFALRGVPDVHGETPPGCRRIDRCRGGCATTRPAPWPADRTGPGTRRPAPRMPSMTKLTARRLGSTWRVTGRSAVSGSSSRSLSTVRVCASQRQCVLRAHPHADVGGAALVAAARAGDQRPAATRRVSPNGSGSGSANGGTAASSSVSAARSDIGTCCRRHAPRRAAPLGGVDVAAA